MLGPHEQYESVLARHDKPASYGTASLKLPPGRTNVLERKARKREKTREKNAMHTSLNQNNERSRRPTSRTQTSEWRHNVSYTTEK